MDHNDEPLVKSIPMPHEIRTWPALEEDNAAPKLSSEELGEWTSRAHSGDINAKRFLYSFFNQAGDQDNAIYWLNDLGEAGDSAALFLMGRLKQLKYNDTVSALNYYERSANLGYPIAQYELGKIYYSGSLRDKDLGKSYFWLRISWLLGVADAKNKLDEIASLLTLEQLTQLNIDTKLWINELRRQ